MLCNQIWWKVAWHHVAHMSIDIIILSVFLTFHLKVHFVSCLFISSLSFRLSLLFVQYGMLQTCFQLPEKYQIPIKWLRFTNLTFLREFKEEKFLANTIRNIWLYYICIISQSYSKILILKREHKCSNYPLYPTCIAKLCCILLCYSRIMIR